MKFFIICLLAFVSLSAGAKDLCLNRDFQATNASFVVPAGKYEFIESTGITTKYKVPTNKVSGTQQITNIRVRSTIEYMGKQYICFGTDTNGSFCGYVQVKGIKDKPFEQCKE